MDFDQFIALSSSSARQRNKISKRLSGFSSFLVGRGLVIDQAKDLSTEDFLGFFDSISSLDERSKMRSTLRQLSKLRGEKWLLPTAVIRVERKARAEVTQRILSFEELSLLNKSSMLLSHRDRSLYMVLRDTGLNYTEFLSLRIGDVFPSSIRVRFGSGSALFDRLLPLKEDTDLSLREYLLERGVCDTSDFLWLGRKGPLTSARVGAILKDLSSCLESSITAIDLRHTFALSLFESGLDNLEILRLLGLGSVNHLRNLSYAAPFLDK